MSDEAVELIGTTLPNMMPLFVAVDENSPETIMEQRPDLSVFYLIAAGEHVDNLTLFRVSNCLIGWAVNKYADSIKAPTGLPKMKTRAQYRMPVIPNELIERVDSFFRTVASNLGTEAIVLLTWDRTKEEWGVLVPDQQNTPGYCNYDQDSVFQEKPDEVEIVGTMHSHPKMTAFASGTDHKDQATFDGLHITFGYPPNKVGTEYYAEMQLGGTAWELDLAFIFESIKEGDPFPELEDWKNRVTEAPPTPPVGFQGSMAGHRGTAPTTGTFKTPKMRELDVRANRPAGCPNPNEYTLITNIEPDSDNCPVCKRKLDATSVKHRSCVTCQTFYLLGGETYDEMLKHRASLNLTLIDLDFNTRPHTLVKSILYWKRKLSATNSEVVLNTEVIPLHKLPKDTNKSLAVFTGGTAPALPAATTADDPDMADYLNFFG